MKFFKFILALSIIVFITSCGNNKEIERHSLETVLSNADEIFEHSFPNLDLSRLQNNLHFGDIEKLYSFEIQNIGHEFDESSPYYAQTEIEFIDFLRRFGSVPNEGEPIFSTLFSFFEYRDTGRNLRFDFCRNRTFSVTADDMENRMLHGNPCISFSFVRGNEVDVDFVPIEGFPPEEAFDLIKENIWIEIIETISEDDISINSIATFEKNDGSYGYHIVLAKQMRGVNLSESGTFTHASSGFTRPTFISIKIDENREIYYVINFYSNLYDEGSFTEISGDSFISLKTALDLLSDYLAVYNTFEVERIDLVYFLPTRFVDSDDEVISEFAYTRYRAGFEITLANNAVGISHADLAPRISAFVDIVTGEIFVLDAIRNERFFTMD